MKIQGFYLLPHPPIIIPEVGTGEERKIKNTGNAFREIAKEVQQKAPHTIILITPHGTMFNDAINLVYEDTLRGSLKQFGVPNVKMEVKINKSLTNKIFEIAREENIPAVMSTKEFLKDYNISLSLDHGAMVPLYFINQYYTDYTLVHITYSPLSVVELYQFGMEIKRAVEESNEKTIIIASGDLSHRLKDEGPYDYSPFGEKFDNEFLHHLQEGDVMNVFKMDKKTVQNAGECGRRSVLIMLGALDRSAFKGHLLSYEKTFGVGYGIMRFEITGDEDSRLETIKNLRYEKKQNQKDPYVKLARDSLTSYLETGKFLDKIPSYVTSEMRNTKRGVFVSLKKDGELRGCIGTIFPATSSIAHEIIRNAVEAGIHDPRFYPVEAHELLDIDFSVDVLTEPEKADKSTLDPKEYGVIVRSKGRTGLLLPDLEGIDTIEKQIDIALKKAGIQPSEQYDIERFRVIRHREE